jgi:hypothetical protein
MRFDDRENHSECHSERSEESGSSSQTARFFAALRVTIAIGLLCLLGCRASNNTQALKPELAKNDADAQMDFWHSLTDVPVTSNDEAFHGLLLYLHEKDDAADYAGRVRLLKTEKLLPSSFDQPATAPATRGTIAIALVHAMHIKGGVNLHLLPMSERYATRELQFLNVYPPSTPNQTFSGNEFVGIIGRVEDYQRGDPTEVSVVAPTGEMRK